ncbi:MAG: thiosulfate oxidation carrier protein SoxY [Methylococcales bacterium]
MSDHRRAFIKKSLVVTGYVVAALNGVFVSEQVCAQSILEETLKNLFNDKKIRDSDKIDIKIPKIAENGAVVPIAVSTSLNNVESISILVEKNPIPLSAKFVLSPELDPFVSARLKMAASSDVIVMVETSDAFYQAKQHVSVTIGGCGD